MGIALFSLDAAPVTVSLKGLAIYSAMGGEIPKYWEETGEEEKQAEEEADENKKMVKFELVNKSLTVKRLGLTGAPEALCETLSAENA
jgi:hypothetical protein